MAVAQMPTTASTDYPRLVEAYHQAQDKVCYYLLGGTGAILAFGFKVAPATTAGKMVLTAALGLLGVSATAGLAWLRLALRAHKTNAHQAHLHALLEYQTEFLETPEAEMIETDGRPVPRDSVAQTREKNANLLRKIQDKASSRHRRQLVAWSVQWATFFLGVTSLAAWHVLTFWIGSF